MNLAVQHKNPVQMSSMTFLCRLAIQTQETDEEIPGMCITINTVQLCMDIPDCVRAEEIRTATLDDEHLGIMV